MRFAQVSALLIVLLLASCQKNAPSPLEDCTALCRQIDSFAAVDAADSVLAIVPLALRVCTDTTGRSDSLTAAVLEHALAASDLLSNLDLMRSYGEQRLALDSARFGRSDPQTMHAALWVAKANGRVGEFTTADTLLKDILRILEPERDRYPEDYVAALTQAASVAVELDRLAEALGCVDTSITVAETLLGPDHRAVLRLRRLRAGICRNQGWYREAQVALEQAQDHFHPKLRADSVELIWVAWEMGNILHSEGKFAEAEGQFQRSLGLGRQLGGNCAPLDLIYAMLGEIAMAQGKNREGESYYFRSLEIRRHMCDGIHPSLGHALGALGQMYQVMGRYDDAEEALQEAMRILSATYGPDGMRLSIPLLRIGALYMATGEVDAAEEYIQRAFDICLKTLGSSHIYTAYSRAALARIEAARGQYDSSRVLFRQALETIRRRFGSVHPGTSNAMQEIAIMEAQAGRLDASRSWFTEMRAHYRDCMRYAFSFTSEANKLSWVRKFPLLDNALLTIALSEGSPEWMNLAYDMVLNGKCAVLDAVAAERRNAYCSGDPSIQALLDERARVCDAIAPLALGHFSVDSPSAREDSLRALFDRQDAIEAELSRSCSSYRSAQAESRIGIADIAAMLDDSTVLWDFVRYHPYDLSLPLGQPQPTDSPRYAAFVIGAGGVERMIDLGPAGPVDSLIAATRMAVDRARCAIYRPELALHEEYRLRETTAQIFDLVFAPLAAILGKRSTIRVCPDASLNLIPLDILPLPDGRYVAEEYCLSYVTSARDLVTASNHRTFDLQAVIFADPDYDHEPPDPSTQTSLDSDRTDPDFAAGCISRRYALLPGTRREAAMIRDIVLKQPEWSVREFYGADAREHNFKDLDSSPAILHLATHSYFCPHPVSVEDDSLDNPLLRSGLILAGINSSCGSGTRSVPLADDGVLTALEISATDLSSTDLVVLSSCESGLGDLADGEGVFGLRRAFRQANGRALVSSLWGVPDREAADIMGDFYRRWLSGTPKGQALHEASLNQLVRSRRDYGHAHPALWGSFVLVGAPD